MRLKKIIINKSKDFINEQIQNNKIDKLDINKVPDILYFGSDKKLNELKNRVFLTPFIGIASIFIIDNKDIKILKHSSCNIGYDEWNFPNEKLIKPLNKVHITHNIKEIIDIETGISSGYIYKINASKIKDKLSLFITNDSDRELIYNNDKPLKIIEIIPHTLEWSCKFSQENANMHGYGIKY